ncbi:MAG: ribonuclease P protein subunit, partial [Candidatus Bathyarchaeia archaeon]
MRDLSHILQDEFIGLNVRVVKSTNPSYVGLRGKVIDETKNTFKVLCKNNEKKSLIMVKWIFHFTLLDK